jgi:predicted dehydrogenase
MKDIWLIGTGPMAREHVRSLYQTHSERILVIGRNKKLAFDLQYSMGQAATSSGITSAISNLPLPDFAIVATSIDSLVPLTLQLIRAGVKRILVEKPGSVYLGDLEFLREEANRYESHIYIAYNRRFFRSVQAAKHYIQKDGGAQVVNFDFTERSEIIKKLTKPPGILDRWLLSNSTHVMDTAFFLAGRPKKMECWSAGGLPWHPAASRYCGAGLTENGALFSYQANWAAPGSWALSVTTENHQLLMSPMERLVVKDKQGQEITIPSAEVVDLSEPIKYKEGLREQNIAFLEGINDSLCSLAEHIDNCASYIKIANYE